MSDRYKKGSVFDKAILDNYIKEVYIENLDKTFYIKKLTVKEYEPIAKEALRQDKLIKEGKDFNSNKLTVCTIIQSLVDKDGRKLLDFNDYDTVLEFDNEIAVTLMNEALKFNNPDFVEIKKK